MNDPILDDERLAAVHELELLDAPPEADFDRFTRMARDLLGVPFSMVTLIDRDRQFFASAQGLHGPWAQARQTPLSHSLCRFTVSSGEPLVVADTREDLQTADNLAVRDLSVVAYAGFPLTLEDGHVVGAFCAADTEPRAWSERELRLLEELSGAVCAQLNLRRTLARRNLHDPTTGLPNRSLTVAYSSQLAAAMGDSGLVAIAIAIDDLATINHGYGTAHGDRLLALVARRIGEQLLESDVLGRLSGNVFVVLRPNVSNQLEALALAHRIRDAIGAEPVTVRGDRLSVGATVGLATIAPGVDGDAVIAHAEESLRHAVEHRADADLADAGVGVAAADRLRMRGALAGAVSRGEITIAFQPIVELATGRVRGYEALARWEHPELGQIPPSEFIPVAEASGDIVRIGEHMLRSACQQIALWRDLSSDPLQVTVNVSPVQLAVPNFPDVVRSVLSDMRLPGHAVTLELTEGVFIAAGDLQRRNLAELRELGVGIALDDFGTGYSTLSYLKRFSFDLIKVDRCFLDGLETDRRDVALMEAILSIGSGMEIDLVAEGIETRAQRELLRLSGCHWGQGFLFSEPLPADRITVPSPRTGRRRPPVPAAALTSAAA